MTERTARVQRFRQLDALRGIAALVVLLGHLAGAFSIDEQGGLYRTPLSPFVTGQLSVILFFVLSGFVLSTPFLARANQGYPAFAVRRIVRLYPPVAVAITLSLLGLALIGPPPAGLLPPVFQESWASAVPPDMLVRHYLLAGWPSASTRLDPPIWSLIVEIRASLLFPLLILATARLGWIGAVAAAVLTLAAAKLQATLDAGFGVIANNALGSLLLTLRYLGFFVIGILCAMHRDAARRIVAALPMPAHGAILLAAIAILWAIALHNKVNSGVSDLFYGLLAIYLIAASLGLPTVQRLLERPLPLWLGSISFSLYLVHWPVIQATFALLGGRVPAVVLLAVALLLSLGAAAFAERFVERPSHELSKRLSRRVERRG